MDDCWTESTAGPSRAGEGALWESAALCDTDGGEHVGNHVHLRRYLRDCKMYTHGIKQGKVDMDTWTGTVQMKILPVNSRGVQFQALINQRKRRVNPSRMPINGILPICHFQLVNI